VLCCAVLYWMSCLIIIVGAVIMSLTFVFVVGLSGLQGQVGGGGAMLPDVAAAALSKAQ
jgi:hypothetical protein